MVEILDWNTELGGESLNQSTWNRIRKDMNLNDTNSRKAHSGRTIDFDITHADLVAPEHFQYRCLRHSAGATTDGHHSSQFEMPY